MRRCIPRAPRTIRARSAWGVSPELRTLGDEIRLHLHLAGMDAKDLWNRDLEPRLYSFEKRVETEVSAVTKTALHDLRDALQTFRKNLPHRPH